MRLGIGWKEEPTFFWAFTQTHLLDRLELIRYQEMKMRMYCMNVSISSGFVYYYLNECTQWHLHSVKQMRNKNVLFDCKCVVERSHISKSCLAEENNTKTFKIRRLLTITFNSGNNILYGWNNLHGTYLLLIYYQSQILML